MTYPILKNSALALLTLVCGLMPGKSQAAADAPVVLELFTSQGCSSCPPADELMKSLAADKSLVILSYHVDYWDGLGWKDPYASAQSTARQHSYAAMLKLDTVFTPQLIVDGTESVVGSRENDVKRTIQAARQRDLPVRAMLTSAAGGKISLQLSGTGWDKASIREIRFIQNASTAVKAGENRGHRLESVNNVTSQKQLAVAPDGTATLEPLQSTDDGIAVIVAAPEGKILGAASYRK